MQNVTTTQLEAAGFTRTDKGPWTFYNKIVEGRGIHVTVINGDVWPKAKSVRNSHDIQTVVTADYV